MVCLFLLAEKNASKMFCHDPEQQLVLMPFPIILWEDNESLNYAHQFICSYTLTAFVSEILLVLRHSLVLFLPHLLMLLYHVLSMKYFEDVALFTPK